MLALTVLLLQGVQFVSEILLVRVYVLNYIKHGCQTETDVCDSLKAGTVDRVTPLTCCRGPWGAYPHAG